MLHNADQTVVVWAAIMAFLWTIQAHAVDTHQSKTAKLMIFKLEDALNVSRAQFFSMESASNSFKTVTSLLQTILKSARSVIIVLFWSTISSATAPTLQTAHWAPCPEYSKLPAKDSAKSSSSKGVQFLPPTSAIAKYV